MGLFLTLAAPGSGSSSSDRTFMGQSSDARDLLLGIYQEVRELGFRAHEDFIKREFHFDLDGCRSNREEHIVVLSHREGAGDKMILQVTFFGDRIGPSHARLACDTREILSLVAGESLEITRCDFKDSEMTTYLPAILHGIREEKKLLRMVRW